jgi:hypothetical protein
LSVFLPVWAVKLESSVNKGPQSTTTQSLMSHWAGSRIRAAFAIACRTSLFQNVGTGGGKCTQKFEKNAVKQKVARSIFESSVLVLKRRCPLKNQVSEQIVHS